MAQSKRGDLKQIHELLYQALETELGGELIYKTAISCAISNELKEEWQGYLEETQTHQRVLEAVFQQLELDPKHSYVGAEKCCRTSLIHWSKP